MPLWIKNSLKLLVLWAALLPVNRALAGVPDAASVSPNAWMNITPGAFPSELEFSWATKSADDATFTVNPLDDILSSAPVTESLPVPQVQIVKLGPSQDPASVIFDGNPLTRTFQGVTLQAFVTQTSSNSPAVTAAAGWYQDKVTVWGLEPDSAYAYRVGYGTTWSGNYSFQTRDPRAFTIIAVGDPQIGAQTGGAHEPAGQVNNVLPYDTSNWQMSVGVMTQAVPNAAFVLSLGDQVDNTSSQSGVDAQYEGYFSPLQLLGIPVATIDGNHDYGTGPYYGYHYNLPNQSLQYGSTLNGNDGDYWFRYGSALFMVLNSNNLSASTHDVFLYKTIA
ncbi:MAG TPA: metallophosphoesterase family protein, partial [Acidimicrobiales bacterium]|nr:metallophosphoesterase family protein [Acidimicrobiales bacterium]